VGKGKDGRAYIKTHRSNLWNKYVNKYDFDVILLEEGLSESEAFEREIYWIKRIGRRDLNKGTLVNFTDGGEGVSGRIYKVSEETRKKLSKALSGRVAPNKGIPMSEESKAKQGKKVIDISNGEIYNTTTEAANKNNMKRTTLKAMLVGQNRNKTNLRYL
jgi:predicted GIY-YIG superfamily endonuclease